MEELMPCPICHEDCAFIETEGNWCVYVQCSHCGTHTAFHSFDSDESKKRAEENMASRRVEEGLSRSFSG